MSTILIVDDDPAILQSLQLVLQEEQPDWNIITIDHPQKALEWLDKHRPDVVLLDIKLPQIDGLEMLEHILQRYPDVPVVMMTGHGDEETAFKAAQLGAFDYITKPPGFARLFTALRNALERKALKQEVRRLRRQRSEEVPPLVGQSAAIERIRQLIQKVAPTDARVLITGESGVGKEVVARHIHAQSRRASGPFVAVNCGAIPSELIESELFGHEKGAFTSATRQHKGKFEQAHEGTLFLDEIGEMPLSAQVKLLRAIEERAITRVGGEKKIPVDVRIVAATNKDLRKEIEAGRFRADLFHRLNVIEIHIPPLRERKEDIPLLVEHFLKEFEQQGLKPKRFPPETIQALQEYSWPGNIRELKNAIERLLIVVEGDTVTPQDVKEYIP